MAKLVNKLFKYLYLIFGKPEEIIPEALTFGDVLLIPKYSGMKPSDSISTTVEVCCGIKIHTPFISAAMDTVTGSKMAITMALNGGLGVIHRNQSIESQCEEIIQVKRNRGNIVTKPITISESATVKNVIDLRNKYGFSTFPVVDSLGKLLGLITESRINNYSDDPEVLIINIMVKDKDLAIVYENNSPEEIQKIFKEQDRKKILVVKSITDRTLIGIYFKKDIENRKKFPNMSIDNKGRLIVSGAIGVGKEGLQRAESLIHAGVDILCIDTAQGDSLGVIEMLQNLKSLHPKIPIIAGNVVTEEGALRLIEAGADAIKVGVGPGAICTTREVTGNGLPQVTAIMYVKRGVIKSKRNIPIIADGGIKTTGDVVKAIAIGANSVMMGSVFSGTDEAPGNIIENQQGRFKVYRGMGSKEASKDGDNISNDRYGTTVKKVAEGVSGLVPYKGTVQGIIDKYLNALTQSMRTYQGVSTISDLQKNAHFVKQTNAGQIESGVRDLIRSHN